MESREYPSQQKNSAFKSGYIAIAGRPNTGKSTFLNYVLGRKVAIVTHKAQTTRTRILGVHHRPDCQMVFLDTPGIHDPGRSYLNSAMVQTALDTCRDVDLILYFIDVPGGMTPEDWDILARLPYQHTPIILIINKIDRMAKPDLMPLMESVAEGKEGVVFKAVVPMSALKGENVDRLLALIPDYLKEGPAYFPEDQITDQPERFMAAELIREQLFLLLQQELPYALAARVDTFERREQDKIEETPGKKRKKRREEMPELWDMEATILVERESQKGIVIGRGGSVLKRVGIAVRKELEEALGIKLHLKLWVKVKKDWSANATLLRSLGYPDGLGERPEAGEAFDD